jgi:hypothetical protein
MTGVSEMMCLGQMRAFGRRMAWKRLRRPGQASAAKIERRLDLIYLGMVRSQPT